MDAAINSILLSGSEVQPAMYNAAAGFHFDEGNLEKANERMQQAVKLCRDQKLDLWALTTLSTAAMVVKKMDPDGVEEFLQGQLNHPNASEAYKKAVLSELSRQQELSGALVSSIASAKAALDTVQKESPGSNKEVEALLDYGQKCLNVKLFDLALEPLERAKELGAKINNFEASAQATLKLVTALMSVDRDEEARQIMIKQTKSIGNRVNSLMLESMKLAIARTQLKADDFDTAAKTLGDLDQNSAARGEELNEDAFSLKATRLFAAAIAEDSLEAKMSTVIELLETVIAQRIRRLESAGETDKENDLSFYQSFADQQNVPDYLSLAAFEAIAGMDDATLKTLNRTSIAIDSMEGRFEKDIKSGVKERDETSVIIADQRAAAAEIRQLILVRNGKFEEALVVAEQSRVEAQSELLERRLGLAQNTDDAQPIDIKQIQSIADSQKTTLVYFSLVHALDPATRGLFKKDHTVNSPQFLYTWVVRPQQEIKFVSQVLPVRINDLVSAARGEIIAVVDGADDQKGIQDEEHSFVADAKIASMLTRSSQTVGELKTNSDALRQLHQLLIEPIEKWLPESPSETVAFVPQGKLFVLPFAALTSGDGEPLISRHAISISPSAKMLALADQEFQTVKEKNNQGILIVGNPTMPSYRSRPDKPALQLMPLSGAEAEANYIAELFDAKAICGDEADERSVVEAMQTAKYIHLATHGLLEAEHTYAQSYLSSLALAPSEGEDGFLTVRETMQMNLNAEMAVLSGCDTGRGRITGDGVVGLARGYISAGIPTVVVSLWPVSDNSTAFLMAIYYKELLDGEAKAVALRNAMLKTRERFASPHAWAAFTLYGYSR